jgi:hypothetical protein
MSDGVTARLLKDFVSLRGSSQEIGTTWEQAMTNTVQRRDARHRKRDDEATI